MYSVLALTLCALTCSALAAGIPLNPAMRGFMEGCDSQPCWYGITPGVTDRDDAVARLRQKNFILDSETVIEAALSSASTECQLSLLFSKDIVRQIKIVFCRPLPLGEFITHIGQPDTILLDPLSIWYQGQIQILFVADYQAWADISYYTPLREVVLFPAASPLPDQRAAWLDLLVQRKYCQLKGVKLYCPN